MLCFSNDEVGESLPYTPTLVLSALPSDAFVQQQTPDKVQAGRQAGGVGRKLAAWRQAGPCCSESCGQSHTRGKLSCEAPEAGQCNANSLGPPLVVACACMPQRGDQKRPHPPPSAGPCPRRSSASRISRPRLRASSAASTSTTYPRFALLTLLLLSHCGPYLFNPHT